MTGLIDFDISERKTFDKVKFLNFEYGQHKVRLIEGPRVIYTHYVPNRGTFKCLGRDCPVCENNDKIKMEHPDDAYGMPGYYPSQRRHYGNVLDRTMVKVCPACGAEAKKDLMFRYPSQCSSCEAFITEVPETVSDKVKMMNISDTVATQLRDYQTSVLGEDKEPLGLLNFDVVFVVTKAGSGKNSKKQIAAMLSEPLDTTPVDIASLEEFKYDANDAVISLTADEIVSVLSGVSFKDVFAARRATKSAELPANAEDVEKALSELLE